MASRSATVDIEEGSFNTRRHKTCKWFLSQNVPLVVLIVSFGLGIGMGFVMRQRDEPYSTRERFYLHLPGQILLSTLSCLSLPIMVSNVVTSLTTLDFLVPNLGSRAMLYYFMTDAMAMIVGVISAALVRPGTRGMRAKNSTGLFTQRTADFSVDVVRSLFPSNMIEASFQKLLFKEIRNPKYTGYKSEHPKYIMSIQTKTEINTVGIMMMAILTALAINIMGKKGHLLKSFFNSVTELSLTLFSAVVWYSPIGIMFLLLWHITVAEFPTRVLEQIAYYVATMFGCLVVHAVIILPLIFVVVGQRNPFTFARMVNPALLTALRVGSSRRTLPITVSNLVENNKLNSKVVKIVGPLGTTINMNGTVLFGVVSTIFVTQVEDMELDFADIIVICWMALATSTAIAGVPHAGLITTVFVVSSVGVSFDKIALVVVSDWFVDRFRTFVNVLNNCFGCGIVDYLSQGDEDREENLETLKEIIPDLQYFGILSKVQSHRITMAYVRPKSQLVDNTSQSESRVYRESVIYPAPRTKSLGVEDDNILVNYEKKTVSRAHKKDANVKMMMMKDEDEKDPVTQGAEEKDEKAEEEKADEEKTEEEKTEDKTETLSSRKQSKKLTKSEIGKASSKEK